MWKRLSIALMLVAILTIAVAPASAEDQKFALGAGLGIAYPTGSAYPGFPDINEALTLGITAAYFTSSWVMIAADFSYGFLPGELEFRFDSGGDYFTADGWTWYFDILVGVDKNLGESGFLYLAAGLGVASSKTDFKSYDAATSTVEETELDAGTEAGLTIGAGAGLPISERVLGFVNLRYRFIKSDAKITTPGDSDVDSFAYGLGGTELMVGVSFWI